MTDGRSAAVFDPSMRRSLRIWARAMPRVAICNNMVTPYTNRLFNHLVERRGLDLTVISCTAREKNRNWSEQYATSYTHVVLPGVEFALPESRSAHFNVGMWRTLQRLSPDIVAVNGIYPTMLVAALWSFLKRRPLVFMTDGWAVMMPQSVLHRLARPAVVGRSQAVICASEKGRSFFLEHGTDAAKIFVANIVPAWAGPGSTPKFEQRRHDLVWCGRVHDERKNWPFFVALVLALKRRFAGLSVRIIADSPARPRELDQLASADIAFEYTPHIAPHEIASAFMSARILALPSRQDAWGLVCNEAMQCGTPCIVSPFTGVAGELVVDGISGLVRPLDIGDWVGAMLPLITDPARWSAMSKAAAHAASHYTLDRSAGKYVEGLSFAAAEFARAA